MKKVIGLIPLYDEEKESYWMLPGYMKVIERCGALPVMLPLTEDTEELEQCLGMCDGLLLTGGHDVDPAVYGEEAIPECGQCCHTRDVMEAYLLKRAVETDLPVFGICRGIQSMNASLGGTLYQDLDTQHPSETEHHMTPPYDRGVHKITVKEGSLLARMIGAGEHSVNSYHHQAVKELAPGAARRGAARGKIDRAGPARRGGAGTCGAGCPGQQPPWRGGICPARVCGP